MTPRDLGVALTKRLVVSALVVALVVAAAVALPVLTETPPTREPLDTPEYDARALAATPIPSVGEVDPDATAGEAQGTVVIDATHDNRFSRADLEPLVEELTALGYTVSFHEGDRNLYNALRGASAFVVVDPAESFEPNEVTTIRTFTRNGGHLLLVGEPTRKQVSVGFTGTSVSNQESELATLASRYDLSLGTSYLTNTETNGGNHKHVLATPTEASGIDADRVVLFTAAAVHSRGGTVLLRAAENTHEAGTDGSQQYPVAIYKERENVVLVGDSTFLRPDSVTVAGNEAFTAFLVDFLVSGEPSAEETGTEADDNATGSTDTPSPRSPSPATPTAGMALPPLAAALADPVATPRERATRPATGGFVVP